MKKRRQMVLVAPGKDVTLYIPTDTPPEVIKYLNRLKAEGNFSQGIMEMLTEHIVGHHASMETSSMEEASALWDDPRNESIVESTESIEFPEPAIPVETVQDVQKPFTPQDILRQAARNAGKLLHERQGNG